MSKKNEKRPGELDLPSFEVNLFEALFGFHTKTMAMLRGSSLEDEQLKLVTERMEALLSDITAEMKRTNDFNVATRLDAVYDEVKRMVEELTGGGKEG